MYIDKEQLKSDYQYFYKEVVLDKSPEETLTDSVTGFSYCKKESADIREAKKKRAIVRLIDKYRDDFTYDWKPFLKYNYREEAKTEARKLFKEKDLNSIDLLTKAYWGRTIDLEKWNDIPKIKSDKEYGSHFWSAVLLEKEKNGSLEKAFASFDLVADNDFLNEALDYIKKTYNPVPFDKLQMFPRKTYLKDKPVIQLAYSELDETYRESELQYIDFIKKKFSKKSKLK
jgi:hypothetical protein